jgi:hypothetical protein
VSNCVGRNNYKYFTWFVSLVCADCIMMFAIAIAAIVKACALQPSDGFDALIDAFSELPLPTFSALFLCLYAFCTIWSVGGLAGYHFHLASNNVTTHESMYGMYRHGEYNPRNRGTFCNLWIAWCAPTFPSAYKYMRNDRPVRV